MTDDEAEEEHSAEKVDSLDGRLRFGNKAEDNGICIFGAAAAAAAPLDERFMVGGATILGDVWRCCFCRRRVPFV